MDMDSDLRSSSDVLLPFLLWLSEGVVTLAGSGEGGFDQLVQAFDQKQVMFGVLKVLGKDVRKSVESIRPKFIFFSFIGEEVPVLQRARVSVQRPDVEKIFNGYAVRMDISGGNMSTFSKAEIAKELLRCGGAHAPTHYVFGQPASESGH
jgi:hypothetical protein